MSKLLGALSQLANVLIFRKGAHPNESISARCHRQGFIEQDSEWLERRERVNRWFKRWKDEDDHCYNAHLSDKKWAEELLKLHKTPTKTTV